MKEIYKSVTTILQGDPTLVGLVGFTATKMNIRRGFQTKGTWDKLVVYYMQPDVVKTDFTNVIRDVPLIIRIYDRNNDLNVETIAERIVVLLDDKDSGLDVVGELHVYDCSYKGTMIATSWNDKLKTFEKVLRFSLVVGIEN